MQLASYLGVSPHVVARVMNDMHFKGKIVTEEEAKANREKALKDIVTINKDRDSKNSK